MALARAYRWQLMLEEGENATMKALAAAEKISPSYISRLLHLTSLLQASLKRWWTANVLTTGTPEHAIHPTFGVSK